MLTIRPISITEAVAFVIKHHRRLGAPSAGHKFAIAVEDDFRHIRGVLIAARPVARALDDEHTLEIARVATDGMRNANSKLYGHAWRIAKAMGYDRMVTYSARDEPGAALRASGWTFDRCTRARSWASTSRTRIDKHPLDPRNRWIYGQRQEKGRTTPEERMRLGARLTHAIRTGRTEVAISEEIARLRRARKRASKSAVARAIGLSREHVSRRYAHLFRDVCPPTKGALS